MKVELHKEHEWLDKFVGEWSYESDCVMGHDQPSVKSTGMERVRSLSGAWVICEGQGEMADCGTSNTIMTLGYDPAKKKFVGTFVVSIMTYLWVYEGELDAAGKVLTLNTLGPSFSGDGSMTNYQDIIEFVSDDHRILRSRMPGEDGNWIEFMTAHYRRKK